MAHTRRQHLQRGTEITVKLILISDEKARDSDDYLFLKYIELKHPELLQMSFAEAMKSDKLPYYESIRRSRQKLQQKYPELCGSDEVEAYRTINEQAFREYARKYTDER